MTASTNDAHVSRQRPAVGRFAVDPSRTTIRFRTRHLFGLGTVTGTFDLRRATVTVVDPWQSSRVSAVADATSFATGLAKRDRDIRSPKFIDAATHPDITFDSQLVTERAGTWVLEGTLTARGVAAPLAITVDSLSANGRELAIRASATVDRFAHRVTAARGMAARSLAISIEATAVRDDGAA